MRSVRDSALIAFAKARIWESEGWEVAIADDDGRSHGYAQLDAHVAAFRAAGTACSADGLPDGEGHGESLADEDAAELAIEATPKPTLS